MAPRYQFAGLVLLIVVVNLLAGFCSSKPAAAGLWAIGAWLITIGLLVGCFGIVGLVPTGNPPISDWRGVLIDQRNRISLSRFQLVLWSSLVISTVITEGIVNALWGSCNPLGLSVPKELWILLGLSSGSAVAAPIVLGTKQANGTLSTKPANGYAWRDLFYGDDTGNDDQVDFSKVQQFFLTISLVITYGIEIGNILMNPATCAGTCSTAEPGAVGPTTCPVVAVLHFPPLDQGLLAIMAVSQVAYISYKALPQNQTNAPNPGGPNPGGPNPGG
jgi:hypothetical protein